jgi:hypothetical protein
MQPYKATGYDKLTGKRRTITIDASCRKVAREIAHHELNYPVLGTDKVRELLASGYQPKERT